MLPNSERADFRALLRRAQHLAVTRGGQQVTVEHVTLALLEREPGIRRHWRSLGIDDDRAVRELGVTKALAEGHPGRGHRFHTAVSDELVITPEVTQLLRACAEVQGADDRDAAAGLAATLLTFLPPLPGSLMRDDETRGSAESGSAVAGSGASASSADAAGAAGELSEHGSDLTRLALLGKLDPMIGRERELNGLIRVLSRRRKSNPLLVGEPGVGKTALVEGLALRIAHGNAGSRLADARVVSVSLASLLAGTRYRGEFEARVHALLGEVTSADRRTILFVDEFHLIVKAGAAEGGLDLGSLLLAGMARDELAVIGATTPDLYREHLRSAGPLARRVQVIEVGEPSRDETLQILRGIRTQYQDFHGVHITDGALQTAIRLSGRVGRRRPDAAIELVDDAAAAVALSVVAGQEMTTVAGADVVAVFRQRTDIAGRFSARRLASRRSRW